MSFKHEKIPGFLKKTYALIEVPLFFFVLKNSYFSLNFFKKNKEFHHIVSWTEHGESFIIYNLNEFSDKVLPAYFKHKNFASFVRQVIKNVLLF